MPSSSWYSILTYHSWWKGKDAIMQSKFASYSRLKLSILYRKKIADIENRSFTSGNKTGAGRSLNSFHNISSQNAISLSSLKFLCRKKPEYKKKSLTLSRSFMDIYATRLFYTPEYNKCHSHRWQIKFYHFISQYDALFFLPKSFVCLSLAMVKK